MNKRALGFLEFVVFLAIAMWHPPQARAGTYILNPTTDEVSYWYRYYDHEINSGWSYTSLDSYPNPNQAYYSTWWSSFWIQHDASDTTSLTYSLASLPQGATITSAKLYLYLISSSGGGAVTINGAGNLLLWPLGWSSFDVTTSLGAGSGPVSFSIAAANNGAYVSFGSLAGGQTPYLEVTTDTVPEPPTALLLGLGLAGLWGLIHRAKIS